MIAIRLAAAADLPAINAIYNHYVAISTCTWDVEPRRDDDAARWLAGKDDAHPAVVAVDGDELVGWGALSPFRPRHGYRFTVEDTVYVRADHHGRGIGRALLDDLLARARTAGHHAVIAVISADQAPSVRLHEAAGFAHAALLRQVGHKFDRWLDLAMLQRVL